MDVHTNSHTSSSSRSLARRVAVSASYVICIVGSMIGVGVFGGTPINEAAGGALATDATYLAPASSAFSAWSLIYVALGVYTVWQWWDRDDPRRIGWLVTASLLLNAAWILSIQFDQLWLSVVVILALLTVLALAFRRLASEAPRTRAEAIAADGAVGLYLGWVCVATCANIAAALVRAGITGGEYAEWFAVGVILIVATVGVAVALWGRGRLAVAATLTWGLAWIAVERSTGEPESAATAITAGLAAVVIAVVTVVTRIYADRSR